MFKIRSRPGRIHRLSRRRRAGPGGYTYREIDPNEDVVAQYQARAHESPYASGTKGQPSIPNRYPAISNEVPRNADCPCGSERKFKHCHGKYAWLPRWIRLPRRRRPTQHDPQPPRADD